MAQSHTDDTSPIESVDRALLALQELAGVGARGMVLADLAAALGVNKTTLHRSLAALRFRGFVAQDPASGSYLLGPAATALADDYLSDENLPLLLHPALLALSSAVGELVHLGVLSGSHVLYLDKVEPERSVRVWSAVGRRLPAVTTALGRAMLAYRHVDRTLLSQYLAAAAGGVGDVERVWAIIERARSNGYATEEQENEAGISCVALPVLRSSAAIAAVSITAPAERMTPDRVVWLHQEMQRVLPPLMPAGLSVPAA
jgi:DNA-binding IclR family transcriptional regulator